MVHLFISSAQKEFAVERAALRDYIRGDALFRKFFDVFLFEDLPASDRRADAVYIDNNLVPIMCGSRATTLSRETITSGTMAAGRGRPIRARTGLTRIRHRRGPTPVVGKAIA